MTQLKCHIFYADWYKRLVGVGKDAFAKMVSIIQEEDKVKMSRGGKPSQLVQLAAKLKILDRLLRIAPLTPISGTTVKLSPRLLAISTLVRPVLNSLMKKCFFLKIFSLKNQEIEMTTIPDVDKGIQLLKSQIKDLSESYSFWGRKFYLADKKTPRSLKELLDIYSLLWECTFSPSVQISAEIKNQRHKHLIECRDILMKADKTSDEKFFAGAANSFSQRILSIWIRFIRLFSNSREAVDAVNSLSIETQDRKFQKLTVLQEMHDRAAKMLRVSTTDVRRDRRARAAREASVETLARWGVPEL